MFQERAKTLRGISLSIDAVCIMLGFGAALLLRAFHGQIPVLRTLIPATPWGAESAVRADYAMLLAASLAAWLLALYRTKLYESPGAQHPASILSAYTKALILAVLATAAVTFVLKMAGISRVFFGYFFGISFAILFSKQLVVSHFLRQLQYAAAGRRHALVIGAGKPAEQLCRVLEDSGETGYQLVGLLLAGEPAAGETLDCPVIGKLEELDTVLVQNPVDEVFVVGGARDLALLAPVAERLLETGRVVSLVAALESGAHGVRGRITEFSGVPMLSFGPMPRDEVASVSKRAFDITLSALGLVVSLPLMLATAVAIRAFDPGPLLFRQKRLGQNGTPFTLYKFRSMRQDAEDFLKDDPELYQRYLENDHKLAENEDPRITRLGRFLRKSSLDELPQLWNVLRGDMSLVGPRPVTPPQIGQFGAHASTILAVRPGITGHWQINGRSDVQYPERAFMDLDYAGQNSIASDLITLIRTLPAVISRKGSH